MLGALYNSPLSKWKIFYLFSLSDVRCVPSSSNSLGCNTTFLSFSYRRTIISSLVLPPPLSLSFPGQGPP